jgi:hypothetical protein
MQKACVAPEGGAVFRARIGCEARWHVGALGYAPRVAS